jgi:hypothetical protein
MAAFGQIWSKSQESAIEPVVDRPFDHAPTRNGLRRRAGRGAVPEPMKILEACSRGGEVAFVDQGLGVDDGSPEVGKIHRLRESRVGHEPAGDIGCDEGCRRHTQEQRKQGDRLSPTRVEMRRMIAASYDSD